MAGSRVARGLLSATLILSLMLADAERGNILSLWPHGKRAEMRHVSDIVLQETEHQGRHLLGPLWQSDVDVTGSSTPGRSLHSLAGEEASAGSHDPDPDPQPNPARRVLRNDDFIYVAPGTPSRLPLAQASRYWRKGMRAVFVLDVPEDKLPPQVVTNAARFRESFAWYPNFRRMANDKRDHYLEGDRRGALAPVLAYASLADPASLAPYTGKSATLPANKTAAATAQPQATEGAAKALAPKKRSLAAANAGQPAAKSNSSDPFLWMLSGDDDTIFFMRGIKALLRDYDPQLPYFITDSMYVGSQSPQPGVWQMRCYPCQGPWGRWRRSSRRLMADGGNAHGQSKGCGCSTEELCNRHFGSNATKCKHEWEGPVPFGGVGFIFSIGFFKHLAAAKHEKFGSGFRAFENCINAPETSVMSFPEGGDAFMSRCFWRLGFPITDPGYTKFGRYMGEILNLKDLYAAPANLSQGQLPPDALTRWSTAVSMHLGARQQRSFRAAAMTIKYISGVYDLVAELLWPSARQYEL